MVEKVTGQVVSYVDYVSHSSGVIEVDVFHRDLVNLVGKTVTYTTSFTD